MIDARFVPVSEWPGEKTKLYARKAAPFRATYQHDAPAYLVALGESDWRLERELVAKEIEEQARRAQRAMASGQ